MFADRKPPIVRTAVRAWGDSFKAIAAMPIPAGIVLFVSLILGGASLWLMPDPFAAPSHPGPLMQGASLISNAVQSFFLAPLAIAVHRYVLLGEVNNSYQLDPSNPRYLRFVGFSILISLMAGLPGLPMGFLPSAAPGLTLAVVPVVLVLLAVIAIVAIRRAILFPAIALDAPGAGWRNARNDTKGHSWRVALTLASVMLPTFMIIVPFAVFLTMRSGMGLAGSFAYLIICATTGLGTLCALAAAASRLYQALATSLRHDDGLPAARVAA